MDWACEQCTFINADTLECECCGAKPPVNSGERPNKRAKPSRHQGAQAEVLAIDSDSEDIVLHTSAPASRGNQQQHEAEDRAQHVGGHAPHVELPAASSHYALDNCSCRNSTSSLAQHLHQHLQQTVLQTSTGASAAVASLSCPTCSKPISCQDLYKLLGGSTLGEAYAALTTKIKQEFEQSHPPTSAPKCSSCPEGTLVLSISCLKPSSSSSSSSSPGHELPSKQVLHAALQARQLSKPRTAADSAAALAKHLSLNSKYFCSGCTAVWPASAHAAPEIAIATAAATTATADTATAAAVAAAVTLWEQLVQLQQLMLQGATAAATPAAATEPAGKKANQQQTMSKSKSKGSSKSYKYHEKSAKVWAAGTGYGGDCGNQNLQKAMTAAANRQQATDAALTDHLINICSILSTKSSSSRQAMGSSSSAVAAVAGGLGVAGCAVLLGGPLAWLLRLLFSNGSLMDVGGRQQLYRQAMSLLRLIGSSPDLLPLLQLPADDPRDSSTNNNTTATAHNASSSNASSTCTLMSVLLRLQQQANLFRKSAADLMAGDDDEDTTAAVCLALDISSLVQDVSEANSMFTATMVAEKGTVQLQPVSAAAGDDKSKVAASANGNRAVAATGAGEQSAAANGGWVSSIRQRVVSAVNGSTRDAEAADSRGNAAAAEARYVSALRPFQFIEADLMRGGNFYFRNIAEKQKAAGGEVMRKRLRRITEELGSLSTSLPLSADSSILLACDSERMDVLRALLLPHADTPYGGGAFFFDILLPQEYPNKPPQVQFLTTGGGRVRFNPNLYNCGKVCLSLLGTWSGPSWEPGVSTLLQVLVSLQSMVFVPDPYYNEPGYERDTASRQAANRYNQGIRIHTAQHAILEALQQPDPLFKAALQLHYSLRGPAVLEMLQKWTDQAGKEKDKLKGIVKQIKTELSKLPQSGAETARARNPVQQQAELPQPRPNKRRVGELNASAAADAVVHEEDGVIDLT